MKTSLFFILAWCFSIVFVNADELESQGSINFSNPTNGSTNYEITPGINSITINYSWTISSWATSYTVKCWIDGTLIPNPGYSLLLSYGTHTGTLELKEYDIIGRSTTKTVNISFSFQPSYYIFAQNSFGSGGTVVIDGTVENTTLTEVGQAVRKVWGKNVIHTLEGVNYQVIGGLTRIWEKWTYPNTTSYNIQISPSITSQTTFLANYHTQPSVPNNFQNAASSGNVQISWSASSGTSIQHYEIERKIGVGSWNVIATTSSTSFTDSEVTYDTDPTPNAFDVAAQYRVRAKSTAGIYSEYTNTVTVNGRMVPEKRGVRLSRLEYSLDQNYPNPFNPSTEITYSLPEPAFVTLSVFNTAGQKVADVVNEQKGAGNHSVSWNAQQLPSGVYIYSITAGKFSAQKKMILNK